MFQSILMPPFLELTMDTRWTASASIINGLMFLYSWPKIWEMRKIKRKFLCYYTLNGLFLTIWDKVCSLKLNEMLNCSALLTSKYFMKIEFIREYNLMPSLLWNSKSVFWKKNVVTVVSKMYMIYFVFMMLRLCL